MSTAGRIRWSFSGQDGGFLQEQEQEQEDESMELVVRLVKEWQGENVLAGFAVSMKRETLEKIRLAVVKEMNMNKVKNRNKSMSGEVREETMLAKMLFSRLRVRGMLKF